MAPVLSGPHLRCSLLQLSGVEHLTRLLFLDVSHNQLQSIDSALLPPSIAFLQVGCQSLTPEGNSQMSFSVSYV